MRPRLVLAALLAAAVLVVAPGRAQTPLGALELSTDLTTTIGTPTFADEDMLRDDLGGNVAAAVSGLPAGVDLVAYHRDADGARLLVFDTTVTLPGSLTATPRDVVRWDGAAYSLQLQGANVGIPNGAAIDVVTRASDGRLVLSFDVDVALGGTTYADDALVLYDGTAGTFSLFFDPVAAGIDPALDVDAADVLWNGRLLLSFDGSGTLGALAFDDDDVLEVGQDGANWQLDYDGSARHPELDAADVDAVQALQAAPDLPFGDGFETGHAGKWTWRWP
jgi:hypothetical protein